MAGKKMYYRKSKKKKGGSGGIGRIIALVVALAIVVGCGIVFIPRLVHRCDNCDKLFVGTGYSANVVTNTWSSLTGKDEKILCRDCAEKSHKIEIIAGKSIDDYKRPLFEKKGD